MVVIIPRKKKELYIVASYLTSYNTEYKTQKYLMRFPFIHFIADPDIHTKCCLSTVATY